MRHSLFILPFVAVIAANAQAEDFQTRSKWDEGILKVEYHQVNIEAGNMVSAWQEMCTKYLLRCNLVVSAGQTSATAKFTFRTNNATGNDLARAFLAAYPEYTNTQDKQTGVLWFHPKNVHYEEILTQEVKIARPAYQIPMFSGVYLPLCELLSPNVSGNQMNFHFGSPDAWTYNYGVDLPAGNHSVRSILNYCCINNPTKCFIVYEGVRGRSQVVPVNLYYGNPLAPPRAAAVKFWEIEIGKPTNEIPNAVEISTAMSDTDPRKRWAARSYLEAALQNYQFSDLTAKSDSPESAVWVKMAIQDITLRGRNDSQYSHDNTPELTNNLDKIQDPGLALLKSLEQSRGKQDTSYLDAIVSAHKFSEVEIASVKPDIYRLVHESPLALDKLKTMKLEVLEFSPKAVEELADTNLFTLVPAESK